LIDKCDDAVDEYNRVGEWADMNIGMTLKISTNSFHHFQTGHFATVEIR